jgi:GFO/IDH/MocA oxidoreductase family protein
MLDTAIVGLGWWGKTLVKAASDFGAPLRFVRGVTLEPETVRDFAAERRIALGTSLDEVLADKSIQAVVLATPHTSHRAQVEAIAAAGKHLYCEKPFALSKADAKAALDACRRVGIVIAVGHHFRLMPSMRLLAELKEAGAFGTINARRRKLQPRLAGELSGRKLAAARGGKPGRRNDRHGRSCARLLSRSCGTDEADQRPLESARSQARHRRHYLSPYRIRERRNRHARHDDEDAVCLAHRDFWRKLLG